MAVRSEAFPDSDRRPEHFASMLPEVLAGVAATWPRPTKADQGTQDLLAQSRRLFVGATACYDNLTQAVMVALQAAEQALRAAVGGDVPANATLGRLVHSPAASRILTSEQRSWYVEFALHFRNLLAHPRRPVAFSPGMSAPILERVHTIVLELSERSAATLD